MTDREPADLPQVSRGIRPGVRRVFNAGSTDPSVVRDEMDEEIRLHLESRIADLRALGLSAADAETEARRRFGAIGPARSRLHGSALRRMQLLSLYGSLDSMLADVRYAIRGLIASPAFSLGVILTLALGIGVNSAVFRLVDRLFIWSPPAVRDPAQLRRPVAIRGRQGHARSFTWNPIGLLGHGAFIGFAFGFGFRHPAHALTAVLALAAVLRRLALGCSLAGIDTRTVNARGVRRHRDGGETRTEQHRGRSGQRRARHFIDLHD